MKPQERRQLFDVAEGRGPARTLDEVLRQRPAEMTQREYLILLLRIAAAIEHSLMVEYLYAAYSLGGDQVPRPYQQRVEDWRRSILAVAKEEMGHLLSVQNGLCLLGGAQNFSRSEYPSSEAPFYPFPFRLEPFSQASLSKYIYAEMPRELEELAETSSDCNEAKGRYKEAKWPYKELSCGEAMRIIAAVKEHVPRGQAHQVSELYKVIQSVVAETPEQTFRSDTVRFQASWDEWGRGYGPSDTGAPAGPGEQESRSLRVSGRAGLLIVARMGTRSQGLAALQKVAGQGESNDLQPDDTEGPSHFERFAKIYQGLETLDKHDQELIIRKVAVNPTTSVPAPWERRVDTPASPTSDSVEMNFIEAEPSRSWAHLFNVRYRMLLTYLAHAYRLPRVVQGEATPRAGTMHRVFAEMLNLKSIAEILIDLPLTSANDGKRAGPPFELPYTLTLPTGERDCWQLHLDLLTTAGELCENLLRSNPPKNAVDYLKGVLDLDRASVRWITPILQGARDTSGYGVWP